MTTLVDCFGQPQSLKVKRLVPEAVLPVKAKSTDSGFDVVAISDPQFTGTYVEYRTGLAVEMPNGFDIQLRPRSSISKYDLVLCNSIGTIDNGYRGELVCRFKIVQNPKVLNLDGVYWNSGLSSLPLTLYKKGDKVAQIVIGKVYDYLVEEVETLSDSERGDGGFGSSGK